MNKFCSNCGTSVGEEVIVCPNCGNVMSQPFTSPIPAPLQLKSNESGLLQTISYKLRMLSSSWLVFGVIQIIVASIFINFASKVLQVSSYSTKSSVNYNGFGIAYIVLSTFLIVVALVNIGFAVYHYMYATKLLKDPQKVVEKFQSGGSLLNFSANIAYNFIFSMGLLIVSQVDIDGFGLIFGASLVIVPLFAIIAGIMALNVRHYICMNTIKLHEIETDYLKNR